MQDYKKILSQFSSTDGIIKGTAVVSNLVCVSCLAILPGFGVNGLLIATSLQLCLAALLEIPTGMFADKFGPVFSVKIGLILKFLVSTMFFSAVLSAEAERSLLVWLFLAGDAIVDSFASAFFSGAYQSAYLNWYDQRIKANGLDRATAPPLFISSFSYSVRTRFLLPLILVFGLFALFLIFQNQQEVERYFIAKASFSLIFLLRAFVIFKVFHDFKFLGVERRLSRHQFKFNLVANFKEAYSWLKTSPFILYSIACLTGHIASFFLMGEAFRSLEHIGISTKLSWALGILLGTGVFFLRTSFQVILFPKLAKYTEKVVFGLFSAVLSSLILFAFSQFVSGAKGIPEVLLLIGIQITAILSADYSQKVIESNLDKFAKTSNKTTWLSMASALGMLLYAGVGAAIVALGFPKEISRVYFLVILAGFGIFSALMALSLGHTFPALPSMRQKLAALFTKILTTSFMAFAVIEIVSYSIHIIDQQVTFERTALKVLSTAITEPLNQGSFFEAKSRTSQLAEHGLFICADIDVWGFSTNNCEKDQGRAWVKHEQISIASPTNGARPLGVSKVIFDRSKVYRSILNRMALLIIGFVLLAWLLGGLFKRLGEAIIEELEELLDYLSASQSGDLDPIKQKFKTAEFQKIGQELKSVYEENVKLSSARATTILASQVAHDIRSPLSALNLVLATVDSMSEEKRLLVRNSVMRITDIANGLLKSKRQASIIPNDSFMLFTLVDSMVSEKRVEFRSRFYLTIQADLSGGVGLFSQVNRLELSRIISNLINNSAEAIENFSKDSVITVRLYERDGWGVIEIQDSGRGIPPHVLSKIGQPGNTHGKSEGSLEGNGLGLWHAKTTLDKFGGKLIFISNNSASEAPTGTRVFIELPLVPGPPHFASELEIIGGSVVVSVDDDQTIHQIWADRLKGFLEAKTIASHIKLPSISAFENWLKEQNANLQWIALVDFEYLGQSTNGVEAIVRLGVSAQCTLVTSRFDDSQVIGLARSSALKILPKNLASLVPIKIKGQ